MSSIQIQSTEITQTITSIKIDIPFIILNTKCVVRVLCYDSSNSLINTYQFELIQPDYDTWLHDNDLINYVCQKYNFSLSNI